MQVVKHEVECGKVAVTERYVGWLTQVDRLTEQQHVGRHWLKFRIKCRETTEKGWGSRLWGGIYLLLFSKITNNSTIIINL